MTNRRFALILALAPGALAGLPRQAAAAEPVKAITAPSQDLTLSFTRAGRLDKVLVRQGQKVRAGELLAQLDDSVEQKQLALLKAKADNTTAIQNAQLKSQRAKAVLAKVQNAYASKAAPQRELEDAQLDAAMTEIDVAAARLEHDQDVGKYEQARLDLDRMRLTSPADGEIERVIAKAGESVNALAAVLRLVSVDPLWIDTPVPLDIGRRLSAGCKALVQLPGLAAPAEAKVIHVSRVADPASETLEVRVELPNPSTRLAGEHVTVTFPEPAGQPGPAPAPLQADKAADSK
jgi:RND family efflux transporter MFP subunit